MSAAPAKLLGNAPLSGGWRLLRFERDERPAPQPGQWLNLQGLNLPVMRAGADWLALLAPPQADDALAALRPHQHYPLAPVAGDPWDLSEPERPAVLLASGAGIGCALFLLERLTPPPRLVLFGGGSWPFKPIPSQFMLTGLPAWTIAGAPMIEERGIPSRLADELGLPGCFEGRVTELFQDWWVGQTGAERLTVFAALSAAELDALTEVAAGRLDLRPAVFPET